MNPLDRKKAGKSEDDGGVAKPRDLLSRGSVPKLLKNSAGGEACCIFRIPHRPENNNQNDYEPRVVSVGPYHHGKKHLQMIQEHKHRYLELFMAEARKKGVEMKDLIEAVSVLEKDLMDSYSENLDLVDGFDRKKLIDMMILDGCFILMLFLVVAKEVQYTKSDDPIFKMRWILPAIRKDLLLLENQVPFILLQTIIDKSEIVINSSGLNEISLKFLCCSIGNLENFSLEHQNIKAKHLLDLFRKTLVPLKPIKENQDSVSRPFLKLICSAKDLRYRGIRFTARNNAKTLLDIGRKMGSVAIPPIVLDDFLISVFRNCVVFEQFYGDCTNPITSYIAFMGCLIRNEADAKLLTEGGIIENYIGMGDDISEIFKDIGKNISFDMHESYLAEVFEGINEYASNQLRASFTYARLTYLEDPLGMQSLYIAFMVLILTVIQASAAVLQVLNDNK